MQTFLRHLPWIVAAATVVSCFAALASRDTFWIQASLMFSIATALIVVRITYWGPWQNVLRLPALAEDQTSDTSGVNPRQLSSIQRILEMVWPQASVSTTARIFVHLTWFVAVATVVSWLAAAITGDDEWVLASVGLSFGTFVLCLATAFPGRFTATQRLTAGVAVFVGLIVVGLMVLPAALSGWPK